MSPHAAILYLWELFDLGLAAGPRVVDACDIVTAHHHAVFAKHGMAAAPIYFKDELDKMALGY